MLNLKGTLHQRPKNLLVRLNPGNLTVSAKLQQKGGGEEAQSSSSMVKEECEEIPRSLGGTTGMEVGEEELCSHSGADIEAGGASDTQSSRGMVEEGYEGGKEEPRFHSGADIKAGGASGTQSSRSMVEGGHVVKPRSHSEAKCKVGGANAQSSSSMLEEDL